MTVKELIDWLKKFPKDLPVASRDDGESMEIFNVLRVKNMQLHREGDHVEKTEFVVLV